MENQEVNPIPTAPPAYNTPPAPGVKKPIIDGALAAMIMGIISVCICWFGYIPFYFIGVIFGAAALILAIMAFKRGKEKEALYNQSPENYSKASLVFSKIARYTGLAGLIIAPIMTIIGIILTILGLIYVY
jgi:beta-lactamase regulating signal transducer with metallopeptidase domain